MSSSLSPLQERAETRTLLVRTCGNESAFPKNTSQALAPVPCADSEGSLGHTWRASSRCYLHGQGSRAIHRRRAHRATGCCCRKRRQGRSRLPLAPGDHAVEPSTLPRLMETTQHVQRRKPLAKSLYVLLGLILYSVSLF